jgi:hypothetical protein
MGKFVSGLGNRSQETPSIPEGKEIVLEQISSEGSDSNAEKLFIGLSLFDKAIVHESLDYNIKNLAQTVQTFEGTDFSNFSKNIQKIREKGETLLVLLKSLSEGHAKAKNQTQLQNRVKYIDSALRSFQSEVNFIQNLNTMAADFAPDEDFQEKFQAKLLTMNIEKFQKAYAAFIHTYQSNNKVGLKKTIKVKAFTQWAKQNAMIRDRMDIKVFFPVDQFEFHGHPQELDYDNAKKIIIEELTKATRGDFNEHNMVLVIGFWNAFTNTLDEDMTKYGIIVQDGSHGELGKIRTVGDTGRFLKTQSYQTIPNGCYLPPMGESVLNGLKVAQKKLDMMNN